MLVDALAFFLFAFLAVWWAMVVVALMRGDRIPFLRGLAEAVALAAMSTGVWFLLSVTP